MLVLTQAQIEGWLALYFFPFARIAGCLMVAPIFAAKFVPARLRIVLAASITLIVAPLLPAVPAVEIFSIAGFLITAQQVLIGIVVGFTLQFIFDAVGMAGQLLANSMGLSFAFNIDPMRGVSTPALGQLYLLLMTMTFVALNGHLAMLEALVHGFQTMPVSASGLGQVGLWKAIEYSGQLFSGALSLALPGVTAMLVVNFGFGVVSRAAPTLNLFAVGLPVALIAGLLILAAGLPGVQRGFMTLTNAALDEIVTIQGGR